MNYLYKNIGLDFNNLVDFFYIWILEFFIYVYRVFDDFIKVGLVKDLNWKY